MSKTNSQKVLLYLSIKHNGNWDKIFQDISLRNVNVSDEELEKCYNSISGNFITILDKEYPQELKQTYKPPFVLFYKGSIDLLSTSKKKLGIVSSDTNEETKTEFDYLFGNDKELENVFVVNSDSKGMNDYIFKHYDNDLIIVSKALDRFSSLPKEDKHILVLSERQSIENGTNFVPTNNIISGIINDLVILNIRKGDMPSYVLLSSCLSLGRDIKVLPTNVSSPYDNNKLIYEGAIPLYSNELLNE